uniref:Putative organic cation/carnitine transporter n=1 Tax=Ornithodoros turicata TaxID=34597 RepID=A0A2R5L9S5_9ACAR
MTFEDALHEIGGYGRFNKTVLTAVVVIGTWHVTLGYFGHLFPLLTPESQWCLVGGNGSDSLDLPGMPRGPCQFVAATNSVSNMSAVVNKDGTCDTGWVYDMNELFVTVTMENNWVCGESNKLYTIHTCHWIGSLVGFLVSGFVADRFGRKRTVIGLLAVTIIANLGCVFFASHLSFYMFRFLAGAGTYTSSTSSFILVMEYTVATRRTLVAFIWGVSWTFLATAYPWYAYYISNWRGLLLTTVALDVILLVLYWWAPESSSWLMARGKKEKALALLMRIAKFNGKVVRADHLETVLFRAYGTDMWGEVNPDGSKRSFFRNTMALLETPRIRRNTLLVLVIQSLITLCGYVGSLQLGRMGLDVYATYSVASAFEFPMNIFCIVALDRVGRRWPNVAFVFIGGITCLVMTVVQPESTVWTLVMAVMFMTCFSGAFNITYQVCSEIFPTVVRARAVLLQRVTGELGSILGTEVAATVEYNRYMPLLICGVLSVISSFLLLFLPETVGIPLPQTIEDGENLGKDRGLCFCPCLSQEKSPPEMCRHGEYVQNGDPPCAAVEWRVEQSAL